MDEREKAACPYCGGSGYIVGEYKFPDGLVLRQVEPCGDCDGLFVRPQREAEAERLRAEAEATDGA